MSKLTIYRWDTHGHSSIKIKEICHFSFTSSSLHPSYPNQTEVPLGTEHHNWVLGLFITARKRSLGQGNIFYTCLSFCSRGGVLSQHALKVVSQHALQGGAIPACIAGGIPACLAGGCANPACIAGGIPACLARGSAWGVPGMGGCLVPEGCLLWVVPAPGWCLVESPPRWLLLWVVCIPLECILVNPLFALDIFICSFHKCIQHTTRGQSKFSLLKLRCCYIFIVLKCWW